MTATSYQDWELMQGTCKRQILARGGSFCRFPDGKKGYCVFRGCPRIQHDEREQ